jgi:Fe-S oxidoreductase
VPDFTTPFGAPGYILFWGLFAAAFSLFLNRIIQLFRIYRMGRPESTNLKWSTRTIGEVLLQLCSFKSVKRGDLAGIGHALLFWGFGLFFIGYFWSLGLGAGFGLWEHVESAPAWLTYASILDITGILVSAAVIWAAVRRFLVRPARLKPSGGAGVILGLVFSLMVLHFLTWGFGYARGDWAGNWPPVAAALGKAFAGMPRASIDAGYMITWWLHYIIILGFMVYIPWSKHLHILVSPFNVVSRGGETEGALSAPDLEKAEFTGTGSISNISRRQILDLYSCAECGRCHEICPAVVSGKTLSPREQVLNLKKQILKVSPAALRKHGDRVPFDGGTATGEEIWECVTCRACEDVCPVDIRHVERMVDLRRARVLVNGQAPEKIRQFYRNIEENSNPWGKAWTYRSNWSEGFINAGQNSAGGQTDTIYWSGCLGAYDERIQRVSHAVIRLLNMAGIRFTILGKKEKCCGDAVRRTGNEYLFQQLARQNIAAFNRSGVRKIITNCPHCYHVFKEEYPKFGGNYEVIHHTQLLAGLLAKGRIQKPEKPVEKTIIYHDPCYLARYNGILDEPRRILQSLPGANILEKNPCGAGALCCGAGGGGMWMHETGQKRISQALLDQASAGRPDILATACPYCLTMLENESRERGAQNSLAVMDIIELYQNSLI